MTCADIRSAVRVHDALVKAKLGTPLSIIPLYANVSGRFDRLPVDHQLHSAVVSAMFFQRVNRYAALSPSSECSRFASLSSPGAENT